MGGEDRYLVLQKCSDSENLVLGMAAGAIEAVATQPLTYTKNARQQGLPYTLNPRLLYRGVLASAANDSTLTGVQFVLAGFFQKLITGGKQRSLTFAEEVGAGMASGAVSGIPCTIMELTMIQQQRFGGGVADTLQRIVQERGPMGLMRGFLPAAGREAFFTAGYLGVSPWLHVRFSESMHPFAANFLASSIGGVSAAALTHPLDTIKSCMQGDIQQKQYTSFTATARALYKEGGLPYFFRGFGARSSMIVLCFLIFNEVKLGLAPLFFPAKCA